MFSLVSLNFSTFKVSRPLEENADIDSSEQKSTSNDVLNEGHETSTIVLKEEEEVEADGDKHKADHEQEAVSHFPFSCDRQ